VAAGATTSLYGREAAVATSGGFLLSWAFLFFDVVPLGVAGAVAYVYGPEAWDWFGMEADDVESQTAD
jgi:hypothetical protein